MKPVLTTALLLSVLTTAGIAAAERPSVSTPERLTRSYVARSRKMMSKVIRFTPAFLLRMVLASAESFCVVIAVSIRRPPSSCAWERAPADRRSAACD